MTLRTSFAALTLVFAAHSAQSQQIAVELFQTEPDFGLTGMALEYRAAPYAELSWAKLSLAGRVSYDNGKTLWVGAGLHTETDMGNGWFIEGAFMPGYYDFTDAKDDLGSHLEFLSSFGVGHKLSETTAISAAVYHMSNASLGTINPGRNTVALRFIQSF